MSERLELMDRVAEEVLADLREVCVRVAVAGSVRRRRSEPNDLEIVCIPKPGPADLFGQAFGCSPDFVRAVDRWPRIRGYATMKYTRRVLPSGVECDLFMAQEDNWGLIYAIRTGSADWVRLILAAGWVRAGYHSQWGKLRKGGTIVPVKEEEDLFRLIGLPWVAPEKRELREAEDLTRSRGDAENAP